MGWSCTLSAPTHLRSNRPTFRVCCRATLQLSFQSTPRKAPSTRRLAVACRSKVPYRLRGSPVIMVLDEAGTTATNGNTPTNGLSTDSLDQLRSSTFGRVLVPEDGEDFKAAHKVWSVSPFAKGPPAIIVQARGTQDVKEAVKFARKHGMKLSVRSGGHGAGNPSCIAGGLMVDLSGMHSCHVDPEKRTAVIDGGCLLGDIDRETALYGLAVPLGVAPVTGCGLIVNGGYGLLSRVYGSSAESILELQMVNAEGELITVNKDSDPELFWAVRGAASCLGVVTRMTVQLYDVSQAYAGFLMLKDDPEHQNFRAVARWMRDSGSACPHLGFVCLRALDPHAGPTIFTLVVHVGPESREEKEELLKPLRELGPVQDTLGAWTYAQTQAFTLPIVRGMKAAAPVHHEYWTGGVFLEEQVTEEVIDALVGSLAANIPLPECALTLSSMELLGGKMTTSDAPFGYKAGLSWVIAVGWLDPACHQVGLGYAKSVKATMAAVGGKNEAYVNFTDTSGGEKLDSSSAAFKVGGTANLARLQEVKRRYDPDNVFCSTPFRRVLEV